MEHAGEEIGEASVAAKDLRRSRFRPPKPFGETVLGANWPNWFLGETGKYC
jgi:hypothetical protein